MRLRALALVIAACVPHQPAGSAPMDNEHALTLLGSYETWCRGADALARTGDPAMIVPLLRAYESREEGGSRVCLLDAMDALGARTVAHAMFDGPGPDDRRMAAHLMGLFADDAHLPLLEQAAAADDDAVRREGLRAIATQVQTPAWEASMIRLLAAERLDTRTQAVQSLSKRRTGSARAALTARLDAEPDPDLRAKIAAILAP